MVGNIFKLFAILFLIGTVGSLIERGDGSKKTSRDAAISLDDAFILSAVALGRTQTTGCGDFSVTRVSDRRFVAHCFDGRTHNVYFPIAWRTPVAEINGQRIELN